MKDFFSSLFLCAILFLSLPLHSANLIVGALDPNEVITINSANVEYDTVYVLNNGKLQIYNSVFKVKNAFVCINNAIVESDNSNFKLGGITIITNNSSVLLKDSVEVRSSIYAVDSAVFKIDSAIINAQMDYVSQYILFGKGNSDIIINNSQISFGSGKFGGGFVNNAAFHQYNNHYFPALGMTLNLQNHSSFIADSITGYMEIIANDSVLLDVKNSNGLIAWHAFDENGNVDFSFPAANIPQTIASSVINYQFNDSITGVNGVSYTINIQNTDTVFWGVISTPNSIVKINNSSIIAWGLIYDANSVASVSHLYGDSLYANYTAALSDRTVQLQNTSISAWNIYPMDSAIVYLDSSVIGEALTFSKGKLFMTNSTCNGKGGYFGANDSSYIKTVNCKIFSSYGGGNIVLNMNNAQVEFNETEINGGFSTNQTTKIALNNSALNTMPVVNDYAYLLETFLDTGLVVYSDSVVAITGKIKNYKGTLNTFTITGYKLEYSLPDSSTLTLIIDTTLTFNNLTGILGYWNTSGILPASYMIWLTVYVDGQPFAKVMREIQLLNNPATGLTNNDSRRIILKPNPCDKGIEISFQGIKNGFYEIEVYNTKGISVYKSNVDQKEDSFKLNTSSFTSGVYFVKITNKSFSHTSKIVIQH